MRLCTSLVVDKGGWQAGRWFRCFYWAEADVDRDTRTKRNWYNRMPPDPQEGESEKTGSSYPAVAGDGQV